MDIQTIPSCGGDSELIIPCFSPDSQFFWIGGDLISPVITLVTPYDNAEDTDGIVTFVYRVSDTSAISNCSIYLDGIREQTDTTITRNIQQTFTINNIKVSQKIVWYVSCTDQANNIGTSSTRNLDTELGGSGGGGGGGFIDPFTLIDELDYLMCNLTFNSSLKNASKYNDIVKIQEYYMLLTNQTVGWSEIKVYIDYWAELCKKREYKIIEDIVSEDTSNFLWYLVLILFIIFVGGFIYIKKKKIILILKNWRNKFV